MSFRCSKSTFPPQQQHQQQQLGLLLDLTAIAAGKKNSQSFCSPESLTPLRPLAQHCALRERRPRIHQTDALKLGFDDIDGLVGKRGAEDRNVLKCGERHILRYALRN